MGLETRKVHTIFDFIQAEGWLVMSTFDILGVGILDTSALFSELMEGADAREARARTKEDDGMV